MHVVKEKKSCTTWYHTAITYIVYNGSAVKNPLSKKNLISIVCSLCCDLHYREQHYLIGHFCIAVPSNVYV